MNKLYLFLFSICVLGACQSADENIDASGNFEADETIIAAETSGKIEQLLLDEGSTLNAGDTVGYVDTTQLYLKKKQLEYSIQAIRAKLPNSAIQLSTISEQIETAEREKKRVENLMKANAATAKQLDDISSQLDLLNRQYKATQSSLSVTTRGLVAETLPLKAQIDQLDDQIKRSVIVNPVNGTVLTQYAEVNEVANPGKALYKIANLSTMTLRAYISGNQLPAIKLNQHVTVLVDNVDGGYKNYEGTVTWVSDKAEFTPKTIQTKDERANLVYAIKISVKNDRYLKIGMYGEVKF